MLYRIFFFILQLKIQILFFNFISFAQWLLMYIDEHLDRLSNWLQYKRRTKSCVLQTYTYFVKMIKECSMFM